MLDLSEIRYLRLISSIETSRYQIIRSYSIYSKANIDYNLSILVYTYKYYTKED